MTLHTKKIFMSPALVLYGIGCCVALLYGGI